MSQPANLEDQYHILVDTSLLGGQSRVLKNGDTFAIFDRRGNIRPLGFENHGLFYQGTRFLSHADLKFNGKAPMLLSSNVKENNDFLVVDLMNPDFENPRGEIIHHGTIHLSRTVCLLEGHYYERLQISNFGQSPVEFHLAYELDADYADIFEIRGMAREKRGEKLPFLQENHNLRFGYRGLDGKERHTHLEFKPFPQVVRENGVEFKIELESQHEMSIELICTCSIQGERLERALLEKAFDITTKTFEDYREDLCRIETSNPAFNDWLNQSYSDLHMLLTKTSCGLYPFAGIPWFSTIFGRDGIITALETLWFYPEIARGVLAYLAETQATEVDETRDAEPGKILHETRKGEMAALGEIPFAQYYGAIDSTPLFVVLAGAYYERTADRRFVESLWPYIEAALGWIREYGDTDHDGFVEYRRHTDRGLLNQGWKDSNDSVFHADGRLAEPPIALCEVQGYVYDAKLNAARIAAALGKKARAQELQSEAEALRAQFHKAFWSEKRGMYALALDAEKKPCKVASSNAGHCLWSGIADGEHAKKIAGHFSGDEFYSGWGVRTVASKEARYNPMSYHNGSVWPHDNALLAAGLARYGFKDEAVKILSGLYEASMFMELHRLPELFCGFKRRKGEGPTLYPVACDPQAWATGAVFLLLQACMGLKFHGGEGRLTFRNPALPHFLDEVRIRNLRVGSAAIDISLQRHAYDVGVNVLRKTGDIEVITSK